MSFCLFSVLIRFRGDRYSWIAHEVYSSTRTRVFVGFRDFSNRLHGSKTRTVCVNIPLLAWHKPTRVQPGTRTNKTASTRTNGTRAELQAFHQRSRIAASNYDLAAEGVIYRDDIQFH
jgi:hypothetical protein